MPLQNRVRPDGEIEAVRARGTMMGNRGGCFHREDKTLKPRRWSSRQWICCVPVSYTHLTLPTNREV